MSDTEFDNDIRFPGETPTEPFDNDWEMIRAQLETQDDQHERDVLRQRAKQYAASQAAGGRQSTGLETDKRSFLIFMLDQEQYGIEVIYVRAIRPLVGLTWIPGVPPFYRGVVHLKGNIISVLDLRYFFDLEQRDAPTPEYIVIENGTLEIALLATHVHGIESIAMSEVQPIENLRYAYGVNNNQVTILNLSALFDDERLFVGVSED
jgi:purine-binding chemotaxis protein CheW